MKKKLRILSCLLIVCSLVLTLSLQIPVYAAEPEIASPSGILMEQSTGKSCTKRMQIRLDVLPV